MDSKIVAIPLSYDVNDMPSMKYGNAPKLMLEAFKEVIEIARDARRRAADHRCDEPRPHLSGITAAPTITRRSSRRRYPRATSGSERALRSPITCSPNGRDEAIPIAMAQVGRSIPRIEARAKVTGRAEYVQQPSSSRHAARENFPQHHCARPHPKDRRACRDGELAGVYRVVTIEDILKLIPRSVLRPRLSRSADPCAREGAPHRRAGGGRARRRSARGGASAAAHRRGV